MKTYHAAALGQRFDKTLGRDLRNRLKGGTLLLARSLATRWAKTARKISFRGRLNVFLLSYRIFLGPLRRASVGFGRLGSLALPFRLPNRSLGLGRRMVLIGRVAVGIKSFDGRDIYRAGGG